MAVRSRIDNIDGPVSTKPSSGYNKPQSYTAPSTSIMPPVVRDPFGVTNPDGTYQGPDSARPTTPLDSLGGGGGTMPPSPVDDDSWLSGDGTYQLQLAALQKALADSEADFGAQRTKYDVDYNDALKQLGFRKQLEDDLSTPDVNEAMPGGWNFEDLNTAAGRSFNNQQNDFASRGLLQSSLYGTAQDNLTRSLNDQLGSVNGARQSFLDDIARQQEATKSESTLNQQQARAEALQRRAGMMSIV